MSHKQAVLSGLGLMILALACDHLDFGFSTTTWLIVGAIGLGLTLWGSLPNEIHWPNWRLFRMTPSAWIVVSGVAGLIDSFVSPVVRGMPRHSNAAHSRNRFLSDEEIVAVWRATEGLGTFGSIVRVLLLTAQRKSKVQKMPRDELEDGTWHIPLEPREKGNAGDLVLPVFGSR